MSMRRSDLTHRRRSRRLHACRSCCAQRARRARAEQLALREKDHGIWQRDDLAPTITSSARRFALGLHGARLRAGRPRRHRQREHAGMVLRRPRRPDARRRGGRHLPDQPLARAAIYRPPLAARASSSAATRSRPTRCSTPCASDDGLPDAAKHIVCVDMKGMRHYRPTAADVVRRRCSSSGADARGRRSARAALDGWHRRPAARRRHHPRLHLGHHRPAQGRDADAPQPALCGPRLRRGRRARATSLSSACATCRCAMWPSAASRAVMHLVTRRRRQLRRVDRHRGANLREIAPTFFLGVPRIWEKLQQGFLFRIKDSAPLPAPRLRGAAWPWPRRSPSAALPTAAAGQPARPPRLALLWLACCSATCSAILGLDRAAHRLLRRRHRSRRRCCASSTSSACRSPRATA